MYRSFFIVLILYIPFFCQCVVYKPFLQFKKEKRIVLLTFDDGPNNHKNTTRMVLEVLRKHRVKALFNVIGKNVEQYPEIIREIHSDNHILANHGYTVLPVLFQTRKKIVTEVDSSTYALRMALKDTLFKPLYFRPSMGWYNRRTVQIIRNRKMIMNGLTIYAIDTKKSTDDTEKIIKKIVKKAERYNGGIVVLHDGIAEYDWLERRLKKGWKNYDRSFIPVVTDSVITILKRKGFIFPAINDDCPHELGDEEREFFKDILYY